MLNGGATYKETAEYLQVGEGVVYRCKVVDSWEEYLAANAARVLAEKAKKKEAKAKEAKAVAEKVGAVPAAQIAPPAPSQVVEHRQTVQITATHYMTEELREIKDILKCISAKMAVIVADLYGEKESQ